MFTPSLLAEMKFYFWLSTLCIIFIVPVSETSTKEFLEKEAAERIKFENEKAKVGDDTILNSICRNHVQYIDKICSSEAAFYCCVEDYEDAQNKLAKTNVFLEFLDNEKARGDVSQQQRLNILTTFLAFKEKNYHLLRIINLYKIKNEFKMCLQNFCDQTKKNLFSGFLEGLYNDANAALDREEEELRTYEKIGISKEELDKKMAYFADVYPFNMFSMYGANIEVRKQRMRVDIYLHLKNNVQNNMDEKEIHDYLIEIHEKAREQIDAEFDKFKKYVGNRVNNIAMRYKKVKVGWSLGLIVLVCVLIGLCMLAICVGILIAVEKYKKRRFEGRQRMSMNLRHLLDERVAWSETLLIQSV